MTYEEMLGLTEEYLEKKEVTKGARKKIVVCIQKIKDRKKALSQLEKVNLLSFMNLHFIPSCLLCLGSTPCFSLQNASETIQRVLHPVSRLMNLSLKIENYQNENIP